MFTSHRGTANTTLTTSYRCLAYPEPVCHKFGTCRTVASGQDTPLINGTDRVRFHNPRPEGARDDCRFPVALEAKTMQLSLAPHGGLPSIAKLNIYSDGSRQAIDRVLARADGCCGRTTRLRSEQSVAGMSSLP